MTLTLTAPVPSRTKPPIEVEPALAARIGSPGLPRANPPAVPIPASLPGPRSFFARVRGLYGAVREGADHLDALRARHGDIHTGSIAMEPVVMIWDPDELQKIMRNESGVWSAALGWMRVLPGRDQHSPPPDGLLSRDFDEHRMARKLVQPGFTAKATKGYIERALGRFERVIPGWIDARQVPFKRESRRLLAQVANEIFSGFDEQASIDRLDQALGDAWRGLAALSSNPRLSPTARRAQEGRATLRTMFADLVAERRAQPGSDLFSLMCSVKDSDSIDDAAMVDLFVNVMFGAFDTTSAAVTSMAYLLAKHPAWQERLRAEALAVPQDQLDWASLAKLQTLEWAWKETLRLFPVTGVLPRRNLREVEILGHRLPAGTFVGACVGPVGRHPKWWNEPLRFDPERFSPARAEDRRHPGIYLPFGGGAHACVGMQLATLEAKLLFHSLLTRCRFELAPDYQGKHTYTPMGMVSGAVQLRLTPL